MKIKVILSIITVLFLFACAGGTRGTGAFIDRRLVDTPIEKKPEPKEKTLFDYWFGPDCEEVDSEGNPNCE